MMTFGEADGGKLGLGDRGSEDRDWPSEVNIPEAVVRVACGSNHTLALTQSGRVYTWGQSSHGQLGLGNRILESATPHPLTSLASIPVTSISSGENHSLALASTGHLYTWGDGKHGKLCLDLDTITNHFSPTYVERFRGLNFFFKYF